MGSGSKEECALGIRERGIWKNLRVEVTLELVLENVPRKVSSTHQSTQA